MANTSYSAERRDLLSEQRRNTADIRTRAEDGSLLSDGAYMFIVADNRVMGFQGHHKMPVPLFLSVQ